MIEAPCLTRALFDSYRSHEHNCTNKNTRMDPSVAIDPKANQPTDNTSVATDPRAEEPTDTNQTAIVESSSDQSESTESTTATETSSESDQTGEADGFVY